MSATCPQCSSIPEIIDVEEDFEARAASEAPAGAARREDGPRNVIDVCDDAENGDAADAEDAADDDVAEEEEEECPLCIEVTRLVTIEPCGHRLYCRDCCAKVTICPSCRAHVTGLTDCAASAKPPKKRKQEPVQTNRIDAFFVRLKK
ncbi:hypothetical protein M885DRAFT_611417 [Pelagophyceae sp. CCMP2097]|nr:hypothetical protein M885DRAFT_611417 [Pelagophyceae sp. CCMP2097]